VTSTSNVSVPVPRLTRMAVSSPDTAVVDPSPSNGTSSSAPAQPAPPAPAPTPFQPLTSIITATKLELLSELAALDRGTLATAAQRESVEALVRSLEASGAGVEPFAGSPAPVEGRWQLLYNSKAVFTAR
jgi:hypothetical protein